MARAWISDRWVKDALVQLPDGSKQRVSPTTAQLRTLKSLPDHFRSSKFGIGGRWEVLWREPGPSKHGTLRGRTFKRRSEAEEFLAELEDDMRSGRYIDPDGARRKYAEVADEWAASRQRPKGSTKYMYSNDFRRYVLPKWGHMPLGEITNKAIVAWVSELLKGTAPAEFDRKQVRRPLAPSTVKRIVDASFGGVLRYAVKRKLIGENPLSGVEFPRKENTTEDITILSYADVEALAESATSRGKQVAALIRFLAFTGLRIGEATALQIRDVNLTTKRVRVRRTWTVTEEGARTIGTPKTWEKRTVPLLEELLPELRSVVKGRSPDDYLFTNTAGEDITYVWFYNRVWLPALAQTGVGSVNPTPHDLRHTAASAAIAAGANPKLVQRMLGHKSAAITFDVYAHLWDDDMDSVMAAMSQHRNSALERSRLSAA